MQRRLVSSATTAILTAAVLATAAPGARGDEPISKAKCEGILATVAAVFQRYDGKISAAFRDSVVTFIGKDVSCTRPPAFQVTPGTKDNDALKEIVFLTANRR